MPTEQQTETLTDKAKSAAIWLAVASAVVVAIATAGNFLRTPVRLDQIEVKIDSGFREQERRITKLEQADSEKSKEINGIYSRIERLENAVTNGNQRTEDTLRSMFEKLTELGATARMMERSVQSAVDLANKAVATSENAVVIADDAAKAAKGK